MITPSFFFISMVLEWANDMKASVYHTISPLSNRLVDVIMTTCWSSNQALGKKYERGLVVGTSQAGLRSSETANLLEINHLLVQKRRHPVSSSCVNNIVPLMWEVRGEWADWFQMMVVWGYFLGPFGAPLDNESIEVQPTTACCHHVNMDKISEEWFQHLVESVPQRIKVILKAKTWSNIQVVPIGGRGVSVLLYVIDLWRCHRSRDACLSAQKRS